MVRGKRPFERHSDTWHTEAGFLTSDPVRDFEGSGVLGVKCLHYMATTYGIKLDEMLDTQMRAGQSEGKGADVYPVGFVAARVCWMLLDHFQLAALSDKEITVDVGGGDPWML